MKYLAPTDLFTAVGDPSKERDMILFDVPSHLEIGVIPKRIYCNRRMVNPLMLAFEKLIDSGCVHELKTWDGCFNIRMQRGSKTKYSIHAWGLAIDVNAAWNQLYMTPTLSPEFVKCFTDSGFDWGGNFARKDGMHFQLKKALLV